MSQQQRKMAVGYRVAIVAMGGLMAIAFIPQCGMYRQMRTVAGYYECVRPAEVREAINVSGYGYVTWMRGEEQAQYQFELKGKDGFRMATVDAKGVPTLWRDFVYERQGDELWFTPGLPDSGCERWISRKAPSNLPPQTMPDPLDLNR